MAMYTAGFSTTNSKLPVAHFMPVSHTVTATKQQQWPRLHRRNLVLNDCAGVRDFGG